MESAIVITLIALAIVCVALVIAFELDTLNAIKIITFFIICCMAVITAPQIGIALAIL